MYCFSYQFRNETSTSLSPLALCFLVSFYIVMSLIFSAGIHSLYRNHLSIEDHLITFRDDYWGNSAVDSHSPSWLKFAVRSCVWVWLCCTTVLLMSVVWVVVVAVIKVLSWPTSSRTRVSWLRQKWRVTKLVYRMLR